MPEEGREQLPPHLSPIHAQGGRESCLEGGSERVLILGGPLSSNAKRSQHKLPFHGTTQRVPCSGALVAQAGRSQRRGGEVGTEGHLPADCCILRKTRKSAKGWGRRQTFMPALCWLFYLPYLIHNYHPFWQDRKGGSKKRPLLEAEPDLELGRSPAISCF